MRGPAAVRVTKSRGFAATPSAESAFPNTLSKDALYSSSLLSMFSTEHLQRLVLGSRRKRKERQIMMTAMRC